MRPPAIRTPRPQRVRRLAALLLAALSGVTCTEPTAPLGGGRAQVALAPALSASATQAWASLAAFGVEPNNVRVLLRRPGPPEVILRDEIVPLTPGQTEFSLDFEVPITGQQERLVAMIQVRDGTTVLFEGSVDVIAERVGSAGRGPGTTPPTPVPVEYVGPGAAARALHIAPRDPSVTTGAAIAFTLVASDASNQPVTLPPVKWKLSNETLATIDPATGAFTAGARRGTVTVTASALSGISDAVQVTITPPAQRLVVAAGDAQSARAGRTLPQPVVVEVQAADGLPVPGVTVNFAASEGASVSPASATSDVNGRASATLTLGRTAGRYTLSATAAGLTGATATATATPAPPASLAVVSGSGQSGAVSTAAAQPLVVRVLDEFGAPAANATVTWNATAGTLANATSTTGAEGTAQNTYTYGNTPGSATVTASVSTGTGDATASAAFTLTATPGSVSSLAIVSGDAQSGDANAVLQPFVVKATDAAGNAAPGFAISWTTTDGSISPAQSVTGADGTASAQLTLGTAAGPVRVTATAPATGTTPGASVSFTATTRPGAPANLVKQAGDAQSATAGTAVAIAPSVKLTDAHGNAIPSAVVTFTVASGGGTVTGAAASTDANGVATVGSWTLGAAAGANTLTATSGSLTTTFTATATSTTAEPAYISVGGPPAGTLTGLAGHPFPSAYDVLVVTSTATGEAPAPGVPVTFTVTDPSNAVVATLHDTSDASGIASATPAQLPIPWIPGNWGVHAAVDGSTGTTGTRVYSIAAEAPRIALVTLADSTLQIDGPSGSYVATLTNGSGAAVTGLTLQGYMIQGTVQQAAGGTLIGCPSQAAGTLPVGSCSTGFAVTASNGTSGTGLVAGAATFRLELRNSAGGLLATYDVPVTLTPSAAVPTLYASLAGGSFVGVTFTRDLTVSSSQPAPAGGLVVSVTSQDPGLVTVASPGTVTIPAGATSANITLTGVSAGTATVALSASGFPAATVSVPVSLRLISLPATLNVPFGGTASIPVQLAEPAPAGGTTVTIASSDATKVGVSTTTVAIPAGASLGNGTLTGVLPGTATITASAAEYIAGTASATTTANLDITASSASLNASFGTSITIQLRSSGAPVAAPSGGLAVSLTPADPACVAGGTVTIPAGQTEVTFALAYGGSATLPCSTQLTAAAANVTTDVVSVYVATTPAITVGVPGYGVGAGLQQSSYVSLAASNHGGVSVTLTSADPSKLRLSTDAGTPGSASITVPLANGSSSFSYWAQAMEGQAGSVAVTAVATGFTTGTANISVVQPAFDFAGASNTTTFTGDQNLYAYVGVPNGQLTAMNDYQNVRAGGTALTVTFTTSDAAVATLVNAAAPTGATSATAQVAVGSYYSPTSQASGGVALRILTAGSTTVAATIPGLVALPSASRTVTITGPGITVGVPGYGVGAGLQQSSYVSLGASNHGGVSVTLTSSDPTKLLLSSSAGTPGTASITVPVANGGSSFGYWAQALEGQTGAVTVTATAPGFSAGSASVNVVTPVYDLAGGGNTTTFSPDQAVYVLVGVANAANTVMYDYQSVRAGGSPLAATITTSTPAVATLVTTASPSGTASTSVQVAVGSYYSPTSVAGGGAAMRALAVGTATLSATIPGLTALPGATHGVTITGPGITVGVPGYGIGSGLQQSSYVSLGASNHGGVNVTLTSADPTKLLLAPDAGTAGTASITVPVADGNTSLSYYAQALEGQVGSVAITATATGFASGSATASVVQPAVQLQGVPTNTTTLSNDSPVYVTVGVPNASNTTLNDYQTVRTGGSPLTVSFSSSTPAAQLVTSAGVAATATAQVPVGAYYSPTTVGAGGVATHPLTTGTTTIAASIPGFVGAGASRSLTVTAPSITVGSVTVGAGLQVGSWMSFEAPMPAGGSVTISSSDPAIALVSPDASTAGSGSITIALGAGATSASFYVQGVNGATGTVSITARASGFTDGSATASVVRPVITLGSVPSSIAAGAGDAPFYAYVGVGNSAGTSINDYQAVRAGSPLTVSVASSAPAVGTLVTSSGTAGTTTVSIAPGYYYSPTSLAGGGVAFRPLSAGSTTVSVTATGYTALPGASATVSVTP